MYRNLSTQGLGIAGVESEIIELAVTYRFTSIDPDLNELYHRAEQHGVPYARRLVDSGGVQLGTFRLPVAWNDTDEQYKKDMDRMLAMAPQAAELGCRRAVTLVAPACDQRPYHENFEFHRRRLAEIGQALGEHGIRLGLEFKATADARTGHAFEFIHTLSELEKLAEGIGVASVGVVLDGWHWYVGGGTLDDITRLGGEQVVAVQLADAPEDIPREQLTEQNRLLPNETAAVDSVAIVKHLEAVGYDGPVTPKPDRSRFPKTGRLQIVRMLGEAMQQVWVLAGLTPPTPWPVIGLAALEEEAPEAETVEEVAVPLDDEEEIAEEEAPEIG